MRPAAMRAIILDFHGVIADDEARQFRAFAQALDEQGISLTAEDYYDTYLGMDERQCARMLLQRVYGTAGPSQLAGILERKAELEREAAAFEPPPLVPGVEAFILEAGRAYRLAIASGDRRARIEATLAMSRIEGFFAGLVSGEDVAAGKPDPEIYTTALRVLNGVEPRPRPSILPSECLVVEDSIAGIRGALAAGMIVLGLATTCPQEQLSAAHLVVRDWGRVSLARLESLFDSDSSGGP